MSKSITKEKQEKIISFFKQGKSIRFIVKNVPAHFNTVKKYLNENSLEKKELSIHAKKILTRQKKN